MSKSALPVVVTGLLLVPVAAEGQFPIRFRDATAASGIDFVHHDAPPVADGSNTVFGVGAAVSDFDRDGDADVYVCDSFGWPNRLYRNNGDGTFTDVAAAAGVASEAYSHMALFLDLDDDGFDDLVVLNDNASWTDEFPGSQIFRNDGGAGFTDVTAGSGFEPVEAIWGGATAGDYDRDGDLDLFLAGWKDQSAWLYRNDGDFHFTDVTDAAGARAGGVRPQWAPVFADVDGDGWQDLYCAVDFVEDYLLRNDGDGTFTDVSEWAGTTHLYNDMGVAVADLDNDLDLDIYTTNITGDPDSCNVEHGCNMLYDNRGDGRFRDRTRRYRLGDTGWGWGVWIFDADLDGWREVMAVNGWTAPRWHEPVHLFHNRGGRFVESAARARIERPGDSRALVPLDIEDDGDVDFLVFDVLGPATLWENVSPRGDNHWLTVVAEGVVSNRNGVGARVYVTAGGRTQLHEITAGGSFYAGPPLEAHFGLGTAEVVDEVRVVFPGGVEALLTGVAVDQRLVVVEPAGAPR